MDVGTASKRGCVCVFRFLLESEHASCGEPSKFGVNNSVSYPMKNWFDPGIVESRIIQSDIENCSNFSFFDHVTRHMQLKCLACVPTRGMYDMINGSIN